MKNLILEVLNKNSFDFQYSGYVNNKIMDKVLTDLDDVVWENVIDSFEVDHELTAEQNAQVLLNQIGSKLLNNYETNWGHSVTFTILN